MLRDSGFAVIMAEYGMESMNAHFGEFLLAIKLDVSITADPHGLEPAARPADDIWVRLVRLEDVVATSQIVKCISEIGKG
jgi:hypothetical protein